VARIILQDLTFGNKQVLKSLEMKKALFKISVLCQSVDTWQCKMDHYCFREARCLISLMSNEASTAFLTS